MAASTRIRTFKPRRRPLSARRQEMFERLAPIWSLSSEGAALDAAAVFGRTAPLVLDLGIGLGESAVEAAVAQPDVDIIGVDVHTPGIANTLARIEELGLHNLRVVHGDAMEFVDRLPTMSLGVVRIFFPDPWPKQRHGHRRVVNRSHLVRLVDRLTHGGTLHIATDIDGYASFARRECEAIDELAGGVAPRPNWRPVTRYEQRGLDAGRQVTDLVYTRYCSGRDGT